MKRVVCFKYLLPITFGILFSIGTVYASPNSIQEFKKWANHKISYTNLSIAAKLQKSVSKEIENLTSKNDFRLNYSDTYLQQLRDTEKKRVKESLTKELSLCSKSLETNVSSLKENNEDSVEEIVKRINKLTSKSINSDLSKLSNTYNDKSLFVSNLDNNYLNKDGSKQLQTEIEKTIDTIDNLRKLEKAEKNKFVRNYIGDKILQLTKLVNIFKHQLKEES